MTAEPALRVDRRSPADDEVAAVLVVLRLLAAARRAAPAPGRAAPARVTWSPATRHHVRAGHPPPPPVRRDLA